MGFHSLVREGLRWEITWDEVEVEVWSQGAGHDERIVRHRFFLPEEAEQFARRALADRVHEGFVVRRPRPPTARSASPDAAAEDLAGEPYGAFIGALAAPGPSVHALRERVHRAVFSDWEPGLVGAAWRGGFVIHLRLRPSSVDPPSLLTALLARPATWFLETLVLDSRPPTILREQPDGTTDEVRVPGSPIQAAVDALALATPPPTVVALELFGDDEAAPELRRLAAVRPEIERLTLHLRAPVDRVFAAALAWEHTLTALVARGTAGDEDVVAALLEAGRFPALRALEIEPVRGERLARSLGARGLVPPEGWSPAPLEGRVDHDGDEADEPLPDPPLRLRPALEDVSDPSHDDVSGASGSASGTSGSEPWADVEEVAVGVEPWHPVRVAEGEIPDERGGISPDLVFDPIHPWRGLDLEPEHDGDPDRPHRVDVETLAAPASDGPDPTSCPSL